MKIAMNEKQVTVGTFTLTMSDLGWSFWETSAHGTKYPSRADYVDLASDASEYDVLEGFMKSIYTHIDAYRSHLTGLDLQVMSKEEADKQTRARQNDVLIAIRTFANACAKRTSAKGDVLTNAIRISASDEFYSAIVKSSTRSYSETTFKKKFVKLFFSRLFCIPVQTEAEPSTSASDKPKKPTMKERLTTAEGKTREVQAQLDKERALHVEAAERGEIIKKELDEKNATLEALKAENEALKAEIERLRAENEQLKAAKKPAVKKAASTKKSA